MKMIMDKRYFLVFFSVFLPNNTTTFGRVTAISEGGSYVDIAHVENEIKKQNETVVNAIITNIIELSKKDYMYLQKRRTIKK